MAEGKWDLSVDEKVQMQEKRMQERRERSQGSGDCDLWAV